MNTKRIIIFIILFGMKTAFSVETPKIKNGILDISKWDFKKNGILKIAGKAPFYWKKFLDPKKIIKNGPPAKDFNFDITTLWNAQKTNLPPKTFEKGYGSYLFKVVGAKVNQPDLAFEIFAFSTAYSLYKIEGNKIDKIISAGNVGKSFQTSIPTFEKTLNYFKNQTKEYYILIHSSNYHYRSGGVFYPILLGEYKQLKEENKKIFKKDIFVLGILFIMSLYHFGLYSLRKEDLGSLWFGLFSLCMLIRLSLSPLSYFLDALPANIIFFYINSKLEYLTLSSGPFLFLCFLKSIFKEYFSEKLVKVFGIFALIFSGIIIFTNPYFFSRNYIVSPLHVLILVTIVYSLFKLGHAFYKKAPYAKVCLLGCLIYFSGLIFDIFVLYKMPELPFIAPITFVAFIFIQSYILAIKFSKAYKTAERLSKDLQKEVEIQTKEAVEQKNRAIESEKEVSDLLDNMRQAVFTIDSTCQIAPPVSDFSKVIFNKNIEGDNVFDSIFKDIEPQTEEFGLINSVLATIFNAPDLQWIIMKDHLPSRISIRLKEENKILKVAYTPLYDEHKFLNKLMFIIEDITEVERLEKEMQVQKEEVSKKGQIIQELASSKKDELQTFFQSNNQLSKEAIHIWKTARNNKALGKKVGNLNAFFRNIHSIKGNARIFGLSLISKTAHLTENKAETFKEKGADNISSEEFDEYLQELYELNGQINSYLITAKEIFNIESEDDTKFKLELHELLKDLEFWFGQINIYGNGNGNELQQLKGLDDDIKEQVFSSLKRSLHSIKGLTRSMDQKEISAQVHLLEGIVFDVYSQKKFDNTDVEEQWENPINVITSQSRNLFFQSSHFRPLNLSTDNWTEIFHDFFKIILLNTSKDRRKEISKILYSLNSKAAAYNLNHIPLIIRSIYEAFDENTQIDTPIINFHLKRVWKFFKLIIQLDLEKNISTDVQFSLVEHIKSYDKSDDWEIYLNKLYRGNEINGEPLLIKFFKVAMTELSSYLDFIKVMGPLEETSSLSFEEIIPKHNGLFSIEECFITLKEYYSPRLLKQMNVNKNQTLKTLIEIVDTNESSIFNYTESIDLMAILKSYIDLEDEKDGQMKPEIIEILKENFLNFKTTLKKNIDMEKSSLWGKTEVLLDDLTNYPIKYSLKNLKSMANEISKGLGKKIKLTLKGEQGSLNKEKLNLLKDATVHLVRNSIDHGIELPEVRIERGKNEFGSIEIKFSYDEKKRLIIEIKDDGNGIDVDIIGQKALEKGFISEKNLAEMGKQEKMDLIFLPNLSTKMDVTELSGRGVGMDVVKSNIESIGAELEVVATPGKGTQFFITFPN